MINNIVESAAVPYIIFNSFSAGGKTSGMLNCIAEYIRYFWKDFRFFITKDRNHAESLVRYSIRNGAELIIAVGGDGTIQSVVNGFFENEDLIDKNCTLGIISCGTGQGLSQSLSIPHDIISQVELIRGNKVKFLDVGRIRFSDGANARYFINEFEAGIGGEVVKKVHGKLKKYGGKFSFGIGTILTSLNCKPGKLDLIIDEKRMIRNLLGIVISNGKYTGGGMQLTPQASLFDGFFDILFIPAMSRVKRLTAFPRIYSAKHLTSTGFEYFKAKKIRLLNNSGLTEADGELMKDKCREIEIIPACLRVCTQL